MSIDCEAPEDNYNCGGNADGHGAGDNTHDDDDDDAAAPLAMAVMPMPWSRWRWWWWWNRYEHDEERGIDLMGISTGYTECVIVR
jgi:hypothetical protein